MGPSDDNDLNTLRGQLKDYVLRELLKEDGAGLEEIKLLLRSEMQSIRTELKSELRNEIRAELGTLKNTLRDANRPIKQSHRQHDDEPRGNEGDQSSHIQTDRDHRQGRAPQSRRRFSKWTIAILALVGVLALAWGALRSTNNTSPRQATVPIEEPQAVQLLPADPETGWDVAFEGLSEQRNGRDLQRRLCGAASCDLSVILSRDDVAVRTLALQATLEAVATQYDCPGAPSALDGDLGDGTINRVRAIEACIAQSDDPRCADNACDAPLDVAQMAQMTAANEEEWLNELLTWSARLLAPDPTP